MEDSDQTIVDDGALCINEKNVTRVRTHRPLLLKVRFAAMKDVDEFDEDLVTHDWHYIDTEQQPHGPLKFDHIKHLFFKGNITLYTAVWTPSFKDWKQLRTIPGIRNGLSAGRGARNHFSRWDDTQHAENRLVVLAGYKERLQLFAIDENKFVKALRVAERQIPDVGSEGRRLLRMVSRRACRCLLTSVGEE